MLQTPRMPLFRSKSVVLTALAWLLLWQIPGAAAGTRGRRHHHHHRRAIPHDLTVTPSQAIEDRVEAEIARGEDALDRLGPGNLFDSPYLVSAIVYHDGFLDRFPKDRATADPSRRIVAHLTGLVTPQVKQQYIELLRQKWADSPAGALIRPVNGFIDERRLRRNHHDAIDVFAAEGASVHAASAGIVVLADQGWEHGDPFAVTSLRGGNTVVMFDPAANRFYRYCHLRAVNVHPGDRIDAGQVIGAVGHTGFNAERSGHGEHLHFEVNQYDGRSVRALDYREVLALLRTAGPAPVGDPAALFAALPWVLAIP
jgi:murein DD-endopeptidase MepM/ murein hydrolase activator NlpD